MKETSTPKNSQLRCVLPLRGGAIETTDGETCGKCRDFLFDEKSWTIRYIVADTGGWLSRNEVLLSPFVFTNPEFGAYSQDMQTVLTKDSIEASPPLEADAPISRQYELELARHFDYPLYWGGAHLWGPGPYPAADTPDPDETRRHDEKMAEIGESRLRSCEELTGYEIFAGNESIGKVDDFIVETHPWRIRYLVVKTGSWLLGRLVIFSPEWVDEISWNERRITMLGLARAKVEYSPTFDPTKGVNRDDEGKLYDYYGRRYYW